MLWLITMLSTTLSEVTTAVDRLATSVDSIVTSSEDITRRLAMLDDKLSTMKSPSLIEPGASVSDELESLQEQNDPFADPASDTLSDFGNGIANDNFDPSRKSHEANGDAGYIGTDLELLLQESRAYSHGVITSSHISSDFTHRHTARWSYLSGISLSQVTNLSVLSLPVSIQELWNEQQYQFSPEALHLDGGFNNGLTTPIPNRANIGSQRRWVGQRLAGALSGVKIRKGRRISQPHGLVPTADLRSQVALKSACVKLVLAGKSSSMTAMCSA